MRVGCCILEVLDFGKKKKKKLTMGTLRVENDRMNDCDSLVFHVLRRRPRLVRASLLPTGTYLGHLLVPE